MTLELLGERRERVAEREGLFLGRLAQPPAAGRRGDGRQQPLARPLDAVEGTCGQCLLALAAGSLEVEGKPTQPRAGDAAAEPRGGGLLQPVRLVEDNGVVLRQHPAPGCQVGEVERVIRDHQIGRRRSIACRFGETRPVERTASTRAAVGADRELGPQRVRRLDLELRAIAGFGRAEPALHRRPGPAVAPLRKQHRLEARELAAAEVVLPPLQHLDPNVAVQCRRGDRHVVPEQLLLQRLGRGRDHDPQPGGERGNQVGEALADAGPSLGHEVLTRRERPLDLLGQRSLLGPRLIGGKCGVERAAGTKDLVHRTAQTMWTNGRSPPSRRRPVGLSRQAVAELFANCSCSCTTRLTWLPVGN